MFFCFLLKTKKEKEILMPQNMEIAPVPEQGLTTGAISVRIVFILFLE